MSMTIEQRTINTIRVLAIDAIEKAKSGHPGLPLGAAPMAYTLWRNHLVVDPSDPAWHNRDRFILSAGHGSMLLYALLHLSGFPVTIDDIKQFRQWGSITPGHPEYGVTPGVETTTGPLGQGFANAVGMAIAERILAARFNRPGYPIVDHFTYALCGDGDLMEGISYEAASLAGHLGLGKLIVLYDANDVSLDGPISLTFTEDIVKRFAACNWQVLTVQDGNHDITAIDHAITAAKEEKECPSLIIIKTTIGFGSPNKQGTSAAHGAPLGEKEAALTRENLGFAHVPPFVVDPDIYEHLACIAQRGKKQHATWSKQFEQWAQKFPDLADEWHRGILLEPSLPLDKPLVSFTPNEKIATRKANSVVLNVIAAKTPWLVGGDADLSCSTLTAIEKEGSFSRENPLGRNIHFGVREHAMAGIANGIAYHGGLRPYVATFFSFADYMRPSLRLAALSKLPVIFIFTHDSIAVGEDGPTHQPIEHLASLRCIPNLTIIRPADAVEVEAAWRFILSHTSGPVALVLTRQAVPVLPRTSPLQVDDSLTGATIIADTPDPQAILIATGSEVSLALRAQELLATQGIKIRERMNLPFLWQ